MGETVSDTKMLHDNNTFYSSIEEELVNLKGQLWSQWDQLIGNSNKGNNDVSIVNEVDNETLSLINKNTLTFESLIETLIVAFNQSNISSLTLSWERSPSFKKYDKLSLTKNGLSPSDTMISGLRDIDSNNSNPLSLEDSYFKILSHINWLHGYKLQLKQTILSIRDGNLDQLTKLTHNSVESPPLPLSLLRPSPSSLSSSSPQKPEYYTESNKQSTRDQLLNKTQQLTNNLIKSNTLLQSSILQSDLNLDNLKQQTQSLNQIQDKYSQLETVFNKTNRLVKSLETASNQEKRDVYISLGFLALVISWVVWRRIFKGPTKLFLWLLFKFFKGILVSVGVVQKFTSKDNILTVPNAITDAIMTTGASLTNSNTATDITASLEQAVDDAINRILLHDEL
ncbi:Sec20p PWA37_002442 [Arxiozyma heterogenica]|uniref:Sec20 C-terminal domain-containing protein n=1 Tax=Arxiozyma heterogenica TaxID=278026 RepID=A0AAN7ZWQ6_9SACH|nr:hypothetical protein RI543_005129 [Kazachstania heterogenica]